MSFIVFEMFLIFQLYRFWVFFFKASTVFKYKLQYKLKFNNAVFKILPSISGSFSSVLGHVFFASLYFYIPSYPFQI